jgi:hypothetical protein
MQRTGTQQRAKKKKNLENRNLQGQRAEKQYAAASEENIFFLKKFSS